MEKATEEDVEFAAGILKDCFGRGGDLSVILEDR